MRKIICELYTNLYKVSIDNQVLHDVKYFYTVFVRICMEDNEMDSSQASIINQIDRDFLIDTLTDELPVLRARIGIKQEELSDILGISRQTYSAIETKKRKMTWNMFISLLMFFTQNKKTAPVIEMIGAFPDELKNMMNVNYRR